MSEADKAGTISFGDSIEPFLLRRQGRTIPYGFGCAHYMDWHRPAFDASDYERAVGTLEAAWEAGFRYFDTAPSYCRGESEVVLGRFLSTVPREEAFIATKVEPKTLFSGVDDVHRSLRRSLERLQTDYIDLYQLHDIHNTDGLRESGVLDYLFRQKEEGVVRNLGMASTFPEAAVETVEQGILDSILISGRLSPIDNSAADIARDASEAGLGMINASPVGSGAVLSGKDPRQAPMWPREPFLTRRELAVELYDLCGEQGIPLLPLALQFPLRDGHVAITLTGPPDAVSLKSTMEALQAPVGEEAWTFLDSWMEETSGRREALL